jgi:UDP-N-acetylmuramoylalanine--D-glutamate ligase
MNSLRNKNVLVVGAGRSGLAAARLLLREGAVVTLTDRRTPSELREEMLSLSAIQWLLGGHPIEPFETADLIVVSPGVPPTLEPLRRAAVRRVPIIGEVELASRFMTGPIAAITGTNGKSTTTALAGEILTAAGYRTFVGGNLGTPLCEAALSDEKWDWAVAEMSSFQLETIQGFRPRIAVLLNIAPDHLDRYDRFESYAAAKRRIFEFQRSDDVAVVPADDPAVRAIADRLRSRIVWFGREPRPEPGVWLSGGSFVSTIEDGKKTEICRREALRLIGTHNEENAMAAAAVGLLCGCRPEAVRDAFGRFPGLPHRMEPVREVRGVAYINDSKATNVAATVKSLEGMARPVLLLAGGRDKGGDFQPLRKIVREKVKRLILFGEAREKIHRALEGAAPITEVETLHEAVEAAAAIAASGDAVLLAPACASFDQFKNFEERGNRFGEYVRALTETAVA